jgi:hypothetical protein
MRHRSLFWPFVLIATGLVWLLIQLQYIPVENLWALAYIWPFFLMAVGIALILRSRWPGLQALLSGLVVLGMLLSIVFAPQLGWNKAPAWGTFNLNGISGSVRGSGMVLSQNRPVTDFDSIEINYPAELTVRQGISPSVTVDAEDNLLPQLDTRVSGKTLIIENNQRDWTKRVSPTKSVKITIIVKNLQNIDFSSAGTLRVEKFQTDRLELNISGAGTVNLTDLTATSLSVNLSGAGSISAAGSTDALEVDISGLGSFQGGDLASKTARIGISGAGSATVWVKNDLNAQISGTGSVKYYGSPSVSRQISGLGSVNSLGNK